MKKKLALLLTTLLSVATLTACGNKDASETAGDIVTLPDYKTCAGNDADLHLYEFRLFSLSKMM